MAIRLGSSSLLLDGDEDEHTFKRGQPLRVIDMIVVTRLEFYYCCTFYMDKHTRDHEAGEYCVTYRTLSP